MDRWAGRQVDLEDREEQRRNKATFDCWYNTLILPSSLYSDSTLTKQVQILKLGLSTEERMCTHRRYSCLLGKQVSQQIDTPGILASYSAIFL